MINIYFVPENLELRDSSFTIILTGICSVSFLLIGIARFYNNRSIVTVFGVYLKQEGVEQVLKENMRLGSLSSILLNLSYFICSGLCIFLFCNQYLDWNWTQSMLIGNILPLLIFLIETIGMILTGWISGEQQHIGSTVTNVIIGNAVYAIVFSFLGLFWIMNPNFSVIFSIIFISLLGLKTVIRILKNGFLVFNKGVSWYYIILYFCTLEVLPIVVLYYCVEKNLWSQLSWI